MPRAKKTGRGLYLVALDFQTRDLLGSGEVDPKTGEQVFDGKGGVTWAAGSTVELAASVAAWVNDQQPETLVGYTEDLDQSEEWLTRG